MASDCTYLESACQDFCSNRRCLLGPGFMKAVVMSVGTAPSVEGEGEGEEKEEKTPRKRERERHGDTETQKKGIEREREMRKMKKRRMKSPQSSLPPFASPHVYASASFICIDIGRCSGRPFDSFGN